MSVTRSLDLIINRINSLQDSIPLEIKKISILLHIPETPPGPKKKIPFSQSDISFHDCFYIKVSSIFYSLNISKKGVPAILQLSHNLRGGGGVVNLCKLGVFESPKPPRIFVTCLVREN